MANWKIILLTGIICCACRKPYSPAPVTASNNYLVVEGQIYSGADSTFITLSRTVKLSAKTTIKPELHAVVSIESDQNNSYPLTEIKKGRYGTDGLNLDNSRKYRLKIKTTDNQQFESDYVPVINAPPIDSIYYEIKTNGFEVYTNTHDPKNNTRYYRWDYNETWEINSIYRSEHISDGDTVLFRDFPAEDISLCWHSDTSDYFTLGTSAKLTSDVIYKQPIAFVESTSPKIATAYSILVNQYALTADAYDFWTNLKKTSEQLGSIFDAQPTQINGNIHCTSNASIPVIGYVSVGAATNKRIMIHTRELPAWLALSPAAVDTDGCGFMACLYQYIPPGSGITYNQVDQYINYKKSGIKTPLIPIKAITLSLPRSSPVIGYTAALPICVDCRFHGTTIRPPYWTF